MKDFLSQTIKQIQARLNKSNDDKQYFQGALDAFLLIEAEYKHSESEIEHNQSDRETTEKTPEAE